MAKLSKKKVENALTLYLGNMTKAAEACGVTRQYLYEYLDKYPDLKVVRDESREMLIDNVEYKSYEVAMRGNAGLLKYFLGTLGKDRGYVERTENKQIGDQVIRFAWDGDDDDTSEKAT